MKEKLKKLVDRMGEIPYAVYVIFAWLLILTCSIIGLSYTIDNLKKSNEDLSLKLDTANERIVELQDEIDNLYIPSTDDMKDIYEDRINDLELQIENLIAEAEEEPVEEAPETVTYVPQAQESYSQSAEPGVLNAYNGVNYNANGNKETYYNLPMGGIVSRAQNEWGIEGEYWVREDGVKMYGDYVIVAANLNEYPRGSIVETSLGQGIVLDTGGFAQYNPQQFDIATDW